MPLSPAKKPRTLPPGHEIYPSSDVNAPLIHVVRRRGAPAKTLGSPPADRSRAAGPLCLSPKRVKTKRAHTAARAMPGAVARAEPFRITLRSPPRTTEPLSAPTSPPDIFMLSPEGSPPASASPVGRGLPANPARTIAELQDTFSRLPAYRTGEVAVRRLTAEHAPSRRVVGFPAYEPDDDAAGAEPMMMSLASPKRHQL